MAVLVSLEGRAEKERELRDLLTAAGRVLLAASHLRQRELSILLTDDHHIRALNAEWRDEDKATDVLSFPMDEDAPDSPKRAKRGPIGDIAISIETATAEAAKVGMFRADMIVFLLVHGYCHLLGHDHSEPEEAALMRADEDRFLAIVAPGSTRPPTPY